jgi:Gametolysin peptidase M11
MRRWLGSGLAAFLLLVVAVTPIFAADPTPAPAGVRETLSGTLEVVHGDDFVHGKASFLYSLLTKTGRVELAFAGDGPRDLGGAKIKVTGRRIGNTLNVAADGSGTGGATANDGDASVEQVAPAPSSSTEAATAAAPVLKRVAVVLLNFSNDTSQPYTPATAAGVVFSNAGSVANYFEEESRGAVQVTGDVYGWYTIPSTNANCAWGTWQSDAVAVAQAAGVSFSSYTNIVFAWPHASSCGWAGLGYMPGNYTYNNGALGLRVIAHELSHNFGINHASSLSCTSGSARVAVSSSCTYSEYGDPFTVMGGGSTFHSDGEQVGEEGWLASNEVRTVVPGASYLVQPLLGTAAGTVKLLRVPRSDGTSFFIDVRVPYGSSFDRWSVSDPAVSGVMIRVSPGTAARTSSPRNSKLVDTRPETATYADAPLGVGRTLVDPVSALRITTMSLDGDGAVVQVLETVAPSAPGSLSATPVDGSTVDLSWSAATDNVAVAGYQVDRDGALVASLPASSLSFEDTEIPSDGLYQYSVTAVDTSGNDGPGAATDVQVGPPDTVPPSPPADLTATGASATAVSLAWTAATDDVAVTGYRILRNGVVVANTTATAWTDTGRPPSTAAVYDVIALDRAANASAPAEATGATLPDTTPPTSPGSLRKRTYLYRVRLSWTGARDDVRVARYLIYRVGVSRPVASTTYRSIYVRRHRGYRYYVRAVDPSGNRGPRTNIVRIT